MANWSLVRYCILTRSKQAVSCLTAIHELLSGPPPCNTSPHLAYGAPHGICRSRSWLVCDGIPELFKEKQPTCFGLFKYDDCNFRAKFDEPPDYVTVWYKTDGS